MAQEQRVDLKASVNTSLVPGLFEVLARFSFLTIMNIIQ